MSQADILLIGGEGFIGSAFQSYCQQQGLKVVATTRKKLTDSWYFDLENSSTFDNFIEKIRHSGIKQVVFLAGITNNQSCLKDEVLSELLNVVNTNKLLSLLDGAGIFTIFLSSSQVFDHQTAFIQWDSEYSPTNRYGEQKVSVEKYIKAQRLNVAVVRLSKVISEDFPLFLKVIEQAKQRQTITLFSDYCAAPISLSYVCRYLLAIVELQKKGIYQLSGSDDLSYADMAKQLLTCLNLKADIIEQSATEKGITPTPFGSLSAYSQGYLDFNNQTFQNVLESCYRTRGDDNG